MKRNILLLAAIFLCAGFTYSQQEDEEESDNFKPLGVSISPSNIWFNAKQGVTKTQEVKITNDTKKPYKFSISFSDFEMSEEGKVIFINTGEGKYSLTKWINASPTYFELGPGEKQTINVTIDVPADESGERAAWSIMMVDETKERPPLETDADGNTVAFGVIPSFGLGVYLFQNPPNVKNTLTEIVNMELVERKVEDQIERQLMVQVKNRGDGIAYCRSYLEFTNLNTGKQTRLNKKSFTILPDFVRTFVHRLPVDLDPGKYSMLAVLDFGSEDTMEAAELEFTVE